MKSVPGWFRTFYGSTPLHLLGMLLCFALVGYTLITLGVTTLWDTSTWWQSIAIWFVGAVVLHDLVLFPLYALADRVLHAGVRTIGKRWPDGRLRVSPLNYLRVPTLAVGLLFLLFLPGILEQGAPSYARATGQDQGPFLAHWLALALVIFALSAVAYTIAHLRARQRPPGTPPTDSAHAALPDGATKTGSEE